MCCSIITNIFFRGIVVLIIGVSFFKDVRGVHEPESAIQIESVGTQALSCLLVTNSENDKNLFLERIAQRVAYLLESTGQFICAQQPGVMPNRVSELQNFFEKGHPLVLFIAMQEKQIVWRLYDASEPMQLHGQAITVIPKNSDESIARSIADTVYRTLCNQPSIFLTRIAYITRPSRHVAHQESSLCLIDPVTHQSSVITTLQRPCVAPSWVFPEHNQEPWIALSEFTATNARVIGVTLQGKRWPICSVSGTCVGFVPLSNTSFVYGRSGSLWRYMFDTSSQKGFHSVLVDRGLGDVCTCPSVCSQGVIVYSSRGRIYTYSLDTGMSTALPIHGGCSGPKGDPLSGSIVYSRMYQGVLQVYMCDRDGSHEQRLTSSPGNKIDPCLSPGGTHVVYTVQSSKGEALVICSCATGKEERITPWHVACGYPSWSAAYENFV